MAFYLSIDASGDWKFIAVVVFSWVPNISIRSHIASLNRKYRPKVISYVLEHIDSSGYGVCLRANIREKVRILAQKRIKRRKAWGMVVKRELLRIANHLRSKGYSKFLAVYADTEFMWYTKILQEVFNTQEVYIGKTREILLSDVLAYANIKRISVKKYKNIRELK